VDRAPEHGLPIPLNDGPRDEPRRCVRRAVKGPGTAIEPHPVLGEREREVLRARPGAEEDRRWVEHRHLAPERRRYPVHRRPGMGQRPLVVQVVHVLRPVLDGREPNLRPLLGEDLHHPRVERGPRVPGSGTALDVVDRRPGLGDDEGVLELADGLGLHPVVGLQRDGHLHPRRDPDERAPAPHRAVEGGELVVLGGDDLHEVALDPRVLADRGVHAREDDPLGADRVEEGPVHDLGVDLGPQPGESLLLGLGKAQGSERAADLVGEVLPAFDGLHRAGVVGEVGEVEPGKIRTESGQRRSPEHL